MHILTPRRRTKCEWMLAHAKHLLWSFQSHDPFAHGVSVVTLELSYEELYCSHWPHISINLTAMLHSCYLMHDCCLVELCHMTCGTYFVCEAFGASVCDVKYVNGMVASQGQGISYDM